MLFLTLTMRHSTRARLPPLLRQLHPVPVQYGVEPVAPYSVLPAKALHVHVPDLLPTYPRILRSYLFCELDHKLLQCVRHHAFQVVLLVIGLSACA